MRILRVNKAQIRFRSFLRKPNQVRVSVVTCKSAFPTCPSSTCNVLLRITTVASRSSSPVKVKW